MKVEINYSTNVTSSGRGTLLRSTESEKQSASHDERGRGKRFFDNSTSVLNSSLT